MKKIILLATLFIGLATTLNAQDDLCFKKGTSALNLGVGFGNTVSYATGYYYGYGYAPSVVVSPALTASYEYGITHVGIGVIGAGLEFGYQGSHRNYTYGADVYKETWTTLAFGPRATYHFDFLNKGKFDIYPIIQFNIYSSMYSYPVASSNGVVTTSTSSSVTVHPSVLVAARYFFTPNIGVYSELGYDIAIIKAGLSLKFGGN